MTRKDRDNLGEIPTPEEARRFRAELGEDDLTDVGVRLYILLKEKLMHSGGEPVDFQIDDRGKWSGFEDTDWSILGGLLFKRNWTWTHRHMAGGIDSSGVDEPSYWDIKLKPIPPRGIPDR